MPFNRLRHLNTKECLWIYALMILSSKPMHGYVIRKEIEKRYGFLPGTVTAYKVLYLLNKKGYVKKNTGNRIKTYSITTKGRKELGKAADFYGNLASLLQKFK